MSFAGESYSLFNLSLPKVAVEINAETTIIIRFFLLYNFRSTNPEEGEVLAWDICERFIRLIGVSNDGQYFNESELPSTVSIMYQELLLILKSDYGVFQSKSSNKSLKLSSITSPFIFFVTHFDSITKLQDKFLSVVK